MADTRDVSHLQLIRKLDYAVGFRTAGEVKKAFEVLNRDGEIDKLKQRYPEGFETKRSQVRLEGDI